LVLEIKKRIEEENVLVTRQALHKLLCKFRVHQTYIDLPRKATERKITPEMLTMMEAELNRNDELTAAQLLTLLKEKHSTLDASLSTIRRTCQSLGWVCTRPHYCQLICEVSILSIRIWMNG